MLDKYAIILWTISRDIRYNSKRFPLYYINQTIPRPCWLNDLWKLHLK